jgi:hypothetical protein
MNPITNLEGNSLFVIVSLLGGRKLTDGVRYGDKAFSAVLSNFKI